MNTEKIYCCSCKHKKYWELGSYDGYECKANPTPTDSYFSRYSKREECEDKNRLNDCPDYEVERSWFELLKEIFKFTRK